ncbi:hypothetical protein [Cytobacillus sp. IB215316]|uniref:hypothetical protein n=1 Tax=Cytobacillus sp. IB215316 TaxID=3097354 RepID=UPI002A17C057|nr:hypothetical protein [Cytobacillus sp. IB215316]MDX8360768.1 hypothetical protein [Cytobacillus sp. IB215316]
MDGDDILDVLVLILVLVAFLPITINQAIPFYKGDLGGFDTQIEKTALKTESEIVPIARQLTTNDIMLMLVVADEYTPMPKSLHIVSEDTGGIPVMQTININNDFLNSKTGDLINAKSTMNEIESNLIKIDLYAGPSGMRYWQVTEE